MYVRWMWNSLPDSKQKEFTLRKAVLIFTDITQKAKTRQKYKQQNRIKLQYRPISLIFSLKKRIKSCLETQRRGAVQEIDQYIHETKKQKWLRTAPQAGHSRTSRVGQSGNIKKQPAENGGLQILSAGDQAAEAFARREEMICQASAAAKTTMPIRSVIVLGSSISRPPAAKRTRTSGFIGRSR